MTDDQKKKPADAAGGPVGGERLAEARRLKQISLPDIARELHLDEAKVQALEENRFDVLGAPVFAKGHLRKYADLVGVSIDDVLADYYTMNRASGAPPVVAPPREAVRDFSLSPWVFAVPVVLLLAGLVWWWLGRAPDVLTPTPQPAAVPPAPVGQTRLQRRPPVDEALGEPMAEAALEQAVADQPAQDQPAQDNVAASETGLAGTVGVADNPAPAVVAPAAAAADTVSLTLTFSGDCWTEVTGADGERLFFDLGSSGRQVSMSGTAPLRVLLGNSNNVTVAVNGEPYLIGANERRGETARLTIDR